jgi:hypothetical protein
MTNDNIKRTYKKSTKLRAHERRRNVVLVRFNDAELKALIKYRKKDKLASNAPLIRKAILEYIGYSSPSA